MSDNFHELTVEARPEDLPRIRTFVEEVLAKTPLSEKSMREARLAVDEACANIIEHAYAGRRGTITVEVTIRGGAVAITLRDHGRPFDPQAVGTPDLTRYIKTGKKGGFGLFLIHKIMDEVRYSRAGDSNVLTLVKRFAPAVGGRLALLRGRLQVRSLRFRFFAQASFFLALLVVVIALAMWVRAGATAWRETLARGVALATGLRPHAADLLLHPQAFGPKQTQLIAASKSAAARSPITRLVIADSAGTVWAASDEDLILTHFDAPFHAIQLRSEPDGSLGSLPAGSAGRTAAGGNYVLALPVVTPGPAVAKRARLGTIYVTVPAAAVEKYVVGARRAVLVMAAFALSAGMGVVAFLVGLVVKPIQRLTEGVRAIGSGEEREIEEAGLEELDAIARVVSEAMAQVRDAQRGHAEQERLLEEVEIAKSIQQSLLPNALPEMAGFEIGTLYQAAKEVGGDYYDFVRVGEDAWGLAVADVSGKGVPASMVMMMIRTALRLEARGERSAAEVLERLNRFVTADMHKGMFVTMFYVVLDSRERLLSYASAGHNPLILFRAGTQETYFLKPSGFPVGVDLPDESLFERTMAVEKVGLEQGDLLVAYTDGITEAMNAQREQFGTPRLLQAIKRHAHYSPQEFCLQIERELAEFTGDVPQSDDMTLVAIKERLSATDMKVEARQRLLDLVEVEGVPVAEACRQLGVSPSTYYRYRRLRRAVGPEGLRDRRRRAQPVRLSNEQEEVLLRLVGENPDWGARRLGEALSGALGQDIKRARVLASLKRRKLNSREARRALAGLPPVEPKAQRPPRKRVRRRAAPPVDAGSEAEVVGIGDGGIGDGGIGDGGDAGSVDPGGGNPGGDGVTADTTADSVAANAAEEAAAANTAVPAAPCPEWVTDPESDDSQDQIEDDHELDRTGT